MTPLPPGATIGIIGGGQLGRMLAIAAAQLGYRTHVLCPDRDPPAAQVANHHTQAGYGETAALDAFAAGVDCATYEFENIPVASIAHLAAQVDVAPGARALEIAQDRLLEKDFLVAAGVATTPYRAVAEKADLDDAVAALGLPAVLKTRRFGYDGKGQVMIRSAADTATAWEALRSAPGGLILEGFVDFRREISLIAARGRNGEARAYAPIWNTHENHILAISKVPADIADSHAEQARAHALNIADALGYVGVLAVEYFVTRDGRLLANEIAPRVHNSGHWTIEGARISQFENHIRAIAGWPLGATDTLGRIEMKNLIGRDVDEVLTLAADEAAHIHLYGKGAPRLGRKMGHVTWVQRDEEKSAAG
ncbi:MAG: 5-(carboxyamino)imidazole ribonucleotide synthase [Pseudomonadota bacterium]